MSPGRSSPAVKAIDASAPVFAALGDPTRLRLVARLCAAGPMSIVRLTEGADVTRQAVSKHLNVLAGAGLVRSRRRGRESVWEVEADQLVAARRFLDLMALWWDDVLGRLKAAVEE